MRTVLISTVFVLAPVLISACATAPSANRYVNAPLAELQAQQREMRNLEARVQQLGTRIDLNDKADADDVRAYHAARDELRRFRAHHPTVESGYNDLGWHPLEALGEGVFQGGGTVPIGGGESESATPYMTMGPLSAQSGTQR